MNFLNFLTSGSSLFNCKLQNTTSAPKLEVVPNKEKQSSEKKLGESEEKPAISSVNVMNAEDLIPQLLLTQQQQLINQYMHLNLQLINQKIQALQSLNHQKQGQSQENCALKNSKKKIKKRITCGHDEKAHYAKGMCSNCYHKYGRTKKPWNCPHEKLYASGMCQNCYINRYNKKKRQMLHSQQDKESQVKIDECQASMGHEVKQENKDE